MFKAYFNPDQHQDNFLKVLKDGVCCGDSAGADCQFSLTWAKANKLTSITGVNSAGDTVTYAVPDYTVTDLTSLRVRLETIAQTAGFLSVENASVTLEVGSTNITAYFMGQFQVNSATASAGTPTAGTPLCNKQTFCTYKLFTEGGASNSLVYNGTVVDLGALVYGTDTTTDVSEAFEAAFENGETVTTTDDTINGTWIVTIVAPAGSSFILNGKEADNCGCVKKYVA